jgi:hypothetical protein
MDDRGKELFAHWANGDVRDTLTLNNQAWSDYMRANKRLKAFLQPLVRDDAVLRALGVRNGEVNINASGVEIENGYSTGYEMLHRPRPSFMVTGPTASVTPLAGTTLVDYSDLYFSWLDIIDPDPAQDGIIGTVFEKLYPNHRDYKVDVRWNSGPVQVEVCKAKVVKAKGYPFDSQ